MALRQRAAPATQDVASDVAPTAISTPQTLAVQTSIPDSSKYSLGAILATQARALVITTDDQYAAAGETISAIIKPARAQIETDFKESKDALYKAHKSVCALEKSYDAPYAQAEALLKAERDKYRRLQDEIARREQERLAREQAVRVEEQLAADAQRLLSSGDARDEAEAAEILEEVATGINPATFVVPALPAAKTLQTPGSSVRKLKRYSLLDPTKLKREYMMPDPDAIQNQVDKYGVLAEKICGEGSIKYFEKDSESFRKTV